MSKQISLPSLEEMLPEHIFRRSGDAISRTRSNPYPAPTSTRNQTAPSSPPSHTPSDGITPASSPARSLGHRAHTTAFERPSSQGPSLSPYPSPYPSSAGPSTAHRPVIPTGQGNHSHARSSDLSVSSQDSADDGSEPSEGSARGGRGTGRPRSHQCHICGRAFDRSNSLHAHLRTHSGNRPYECPYPLCGQTFSVKSNMRRHYRNHSRVDDRAVPGNPGNRVFRLKHWHEYAKDNKQPGS